MFLIIIFCIILLILLTYSVKKKKSISMTKCNKSFSSTINMQYNHIVAEIRSSVLPSPNDIAIMNKEEEIFIKTFLDKVQYVRKKYYISLIRYSDGHIMLLYNSYPVGRIGLRNNQSYMQVLKGTYGHKEYYDLTFDECLNKIDDFIRYVKYHLREQRI